MFHLRRPLFASTITLLQLMLINPLAVHAADLTTVYLGAQPCFQVKGGIGQLSAAQVTKQIQQNIDSAMLSLGANEPKVKVATAKGKPVLLLNGKLIASIDPTEAAAEGIKPMQLASNWAKALNKALHDEMSSNNVSYAGLGSRTMSAVLGTTQSTAAPQTRFARMPAGMVLPVVLETDVYTSALRPSDEVVAHTTSDITLPSGEVLAAGTRIFGDVASINTDSMFGKGPLRLSFDRMQLADGTQFPVSASIMENGCPLDSVVLPANTNMAFPMGYPLTLQLNAPVQVAVTGTTM